VVVVPSSILHIHPRTIVDVFEVIQHLFFVAVYLFEVVNRFVPNTSLEENQGHIVTAASSLQSIDKSFIEHTERRAGSPLVRFAGASLLRATEKE
jgi:hypothetical protein